MSALLKFEVQATWIECASCHVSFAITTDHQARLRETHEGFYCPNGHSNIYNGKTEAQKVREEMQAKLDQANSNFEWEAGQRAVAEKKAAAATRKLKSEQKKLANQTKRVEAGVCIHCNRTFQQLARHMQSKHTAVVDRKDEDDAKHAACR